MQVGIIGYTPQAGDAAQRWLTAGFSVFVWDRDPDLLARFSTDLEDGPKVTAVASIRELVAQLTPLRRIFLWGADSPELEESILALAAMLEVSDIVVDVSDSSFEAADRRSAILAQPRSRYVGLGVLSRDGSNLDGASLLLGGHRVGGEAVTQTLLALVPQGQIAYLGTGGTAQLLRNLLQSHLGAECMVLAELVRLAQFVGGVSPEEMAQAVVLWNQQAFESPPLRAAAELLRQPPSDQPAPAAVENALHAALFRTAQMMVASCSSVPSLLAGHAFTSDQVSDRERDTNSSRYPRPPRTDKAMVEAPALLEELRQAYGATRMLAIIQLISVIRRASISYDYEISSVDSVRVLRNAVLMKSSLFDCFVTALADPNSANLFAYPRVQFVLSPLISSLRKVVGLGLSAGIPIPQTTTHLCYFDAMTAPGSSSPNATSFLHALSKVTPEEPAAAKRPAKRR